MNDVGQAHEVFRGHLRELWPAVAPYWEMVVHADVPAVRKALDAHLRGTGVGGEALLVADRLHELVDRHEEDPDEERRRVVCAAIRYFLEVDDAWNDLTPGGLSDDHRVVRAAELACRA